ncbi:XylR family transcriptional regulator [Alienimonas californiensis]|uniref:Xylose operon regulatory protein n=1 Tax=Alienimonas californiensis TaxID=2527989 RepID=A0A517P791_9PLAN|nr:XylR family transcriptional regulator [Alienimonas californiensis]QDT15232.1 Xylose operon regulatory protein [Alienimonas californiensis]
MSRKSGLNAPPPACGRAPARKRVALLVETSSGYGRGVLAGITRFMRMHDDWSVFLEQRDLTQSPPKWLTGWDGDGVISRATAPELTAAAASGLPLVEIADREEGRAQIRSDDAAIGRLAAEHLYDRGYRRFAYCGFSGEAWSARRERGFVEYVEGRGGRCERNHVSWLGPGALPWDVDRGRLGEWLATIPRPLGVMACNDVRGQQVLDACAARRFAVPEDVAVIGVDDDDLLCRLSSPPLSSVIPDAEGVGYRAAELLAAQMNGEPTPPSAELIPPLGIATRQSTDAVAIADAGVAAALNYISQHACRGISVDEVVQNASVSRSTLERKVRKHLGRTPQEEIRQVQVKRACELLQTTDLTIERIAALCGFEHPEYLHVVFKRITGRTPGQFRADAAAGRSKSPHLVDA